MAWDTRSHARVREVQGDAGRSGGTLPAVGVLLPCGPRFLSLGTFDTGEGALCRTAIAKGPWEDTTPSGPSLGDVRRASAEGWLRN